MGDRSPWKSSQFEKKKGCYLSGGPKLVPVDNTPFPTDFGNGAGRRAGEGVGLFGFLWWVGVVAPQRAYLALRLRVVFGFCVRSASAS